jgi:hypothetical protein
VVEETERLKNQHEQREISTLDKSAYRKQSGSFWKARLSGTRGLYLLFPGEAVSLLITGGDGGTILEEWTGLVASLVLNVLAYSAVIFTLYKIVRVFDGRFPGRHAD